MGDFQDILDELVGGRRAIRRPGGSILVHYGDLDDPDDPRWQVIDDAVAEELVDALTEVLHAE